MEVRADRAGLTTNAGPTFACISSLVGVVIENTKAHDGVVQPTTDNRKPYFHHIWP